MKVIFSTIAALVCAVISISAQTISSAVEITTVYSQNKRFYLKSIPFDNESPTARGRTAVYKTGAAAKAIYVFERGFDSVEDDSNNLILSDDGRVVFYVIGWGANEEKEGLKSVTIYKDGAIVKSFTAAEITGCDEAKERCSLIYNNYEAVVDREKSNWGTRRYRKAFKDETSEKEKFLSDYALFSAGDTVYLIDSKRIVHPFDLKNGERLASEKFDDVFERIKTKGRFTKVVQQSINVPYYPDFPKLKDGRNARLALAALLGMKTAVNFGAGDGQYKIYQFDVSGTIRRDGAFEIETIDVDDELPREKIVEFFKTNKFDARLVPVEFERWHLDNQYFYFRNKSDAQARREKLEDGIKEREDLKKRLTAEKIGDVYIPKNLEECFAELDRLLKEIDKNEMRALARRDEMIRYHMGLGMWMRNNWGLWGGSRLQKYFTDKGVAHPDDMSSVVLSYYHDWLNDKRETWKDWEKNPKR